MNWIKSDLFLTIFSSNGIKNVFGLVQNGSKTDPGMTRNTSNLLRLNSNPIFSTGYTFTVYKTEHLKTSIFTVFYHLHYNFIYFIWNMLGGPGESTTPNRASCSRFISPTRAHITSLTP